MTSFADLSKDSEWPPTRNGMPELTDDYPDTLLAQYIVAPDSLEGELHSFAVNLARLADKAASEYRDSRECLGAFLLNPLGVESLEGHTSLLRATDHLENCIDAIRRAEGFLDMPAFQRMATAQNRETLRELHSGVHKLRNSIQHAEDRFAEGRVPEGEPLYPAMTSEAVYFAGEYVVYGEIAALVMMVWELAAVGVRAVIE
jgi:hypothetical protein